MRHYKSLLFLWLILGGAASQEVNEETYLLVPLTGDVDVSDSCAERTIDRIIPFLTSFFCCCTVPLEEPDDEQYIISPTRGARQSKPLI